MGMDHGWDEALRQEHRRRAEQDRYDPQPIERDRDVERRDRLASTRPTNQSPWEIGAAHWDQRDLYTRNSRVDDEGYGRGPSYHPEEGSYAYHRDVFPPERPSPQLHPNDEPTFYERQAWPWLNYYADRAQPLDDERRLWLKVRQRAAALVAKLGRHPHVHRGSNDRQRPDDAIREDVCEALAYADDLDARDVEVEVKNAEVWLTGTVRDRLQKRFAEDLSEQVRGVEYVHNRLSVRKDDDTAFTAPVAAF